MELKSPSIALFAGEFCKGESKSLRVCPMELISCENVLVVTVFVNPAFHYKQGDLIREKNCVTDDRNQINEPLDIRL